MYRVFVSVFILVFSLPAIAQQGPFSIDGHIISSDGDALPNTNILFARSRVFVSDDHGDFAITGLARGQYELQFFYIGYDTLTVNVAIDKKDVHLDIKMQENHLSLNEVIVFGDHYRTGRVEQSQTVVTVGEDFIKSQNTGTLMNSLQKLPGISAINTGVGIAKPVIRGMSFNRVLVMDKGIKQEGQQWGADHGLEIDQFDLEKIEIVKGPASLQYGSDAIGGALRILPPVTDVGNQLEGDLFTTYKSNNALVGISAGVRAVRNGNNVRARMSYQDFGDYGVPANSFTYNGFVLPIYNQRLKNTAGNEKDFSLSMGMQRTRMSSSISVSNFNQRSGLFPGATGIPREYQLEDDGDSRNIDLPTQKVNHLKVISNTTWLFGSNWLEADFGYQYNKRQELGNPHAHGYQPTPEGDLALGLDLQTLSANVRYNINLNEKISGIAGLQAQYQQNERSGYEFLLADFTTATAGVFLYQEYTPSHQFSMNAGVRYDYGMRDIDEYSEPDYTTTDQQDSILRNPPIFRTFNDVSAALGFSYYPSIHFNAKFNLGTSFRMPTAAELSSNGVHHGTFRHEKGDPSLQSERGLQTDLNLTWQKKNLYFLITPFFAYFDKYIYLAPQSYFSDLPAGGQVYQYTQNDAVFTGLEAEYDWDFWNFFGFHTAAEYVWNLNLDTNLPLPFTPPFSWLAELEYTCIVNQGLIARYNISAEYQFFAAQNRVDRNEHATPGYNLVGLTTSTDIRLGKKNLRLSLSAINLLNTKYMNHLSRYRILNLPEQGRNIIVSLNVPL
ncbi:MAG: TonB-dependent receptor [Cyclobacteriaceae bacterium]|nr:TonB-dependent receptor [Cyclobacteriaceae bacterium]